MALSWCKVASNLDSHPKIRKAGRLGREVFLFALRRNAEPGNPVPGRLPKDELAPWYIADQLQMPESEAVTGVTAAVTAGLLAEDGHCYVIVSWKDGWGKDNGTGASRTAKWRENKRLAKRDKVGDARDVTSVTGDSGDIEEKRREETTTSQVDADLTERLVSWIVGNNPKHKITTLTANERNALIARWADHVRLMREADRRDPVEIRRVIDWCQVDTFWRGNILSTESLRKQWDKLVMRMTSAGQPPSQPKFQKIPKL